MLQGPSSKPNVCHSSEIKMETSGGFRGCQASEHPIMQIIAATTLPVGTPTSLGRRRFVFSLITDKADDDKNFGAEIR